MPGYDEVQRQRLNDVWTCDDCGARFIVLWDNDNENEWPARRQHLYLTELR
jgi:hypothetical protein